MNDIPPDISGKREFSPRILGWLLLAIILAAFAALYFLGILPGSAVSHPPLSHPPI
jgi:hypothetical protein